MLPTVAGAESPAVAEQRKGPRALSYDGAAGGWPCLWRTRLLFDWSKCGGRCCWRRVCRVVPVFVLCEFLCELALETDGVGKCCAVAAAAAVSVFGCCRVSRWLSAPFAGGCAAVEPHTRRNRRSVWWQILLAKSVDRYAVVLLVRGVG